MLCGYPSTSAGQRDHSEMQRQFCYFSLKLLSPGGSQVTVREAHGPCQLLAPQLHCRLPVVPAAELPQGRRPADDVPPRVSSAYNTLTPTSAHPLGAVHHRFLRKRPGHSDLLHSHDSHCPVPGLWGLGVVSTCECCSLSNFFADGAIRSSLSTVAPCPARWLGHRQHSNMSDFRAWLMNSCYILTIGMNDEAPNLRGFPVIVQRQCVLVKMSGRGVYLGGEGSHSESQTREASLILALSLKCDSTKI